MLVVIFIIYLILFCCLFWYFCMVFIMLTIFCWYIGAHTGHSKEHIRESSSMFKLLKRQCIYYIVREK
jgi:uncharacterized membrane protein